jgi:hypothetical protein
MPYNKQRQLGCTQKSIFDPSGRRNSSVVDGRQLVELIFPAYGIFFFALLALYMRDADQEKNLNFLKIISIDQYGCSTSRWMIILLVESYKIFYFLNSPFADVTFI